MPAFPCGAIGVWASGPVGDSTTAQKYVLDNTSGVSQSYTFNALGTGWPWASPGSGVGVECIITIVDSVCATMTTITTWNSSNPGNSVTQTILPTHKIMFNFQPDSLGTHTAFVPPVTMEAGAGGEPHFVGFDGVNFDYHGIPGNRYLLWSGNDATVVALFSTIELAEKYPSFRGTTFITHLWVTVGSVVKEFSVEKFEEMSSAEILDGMLEGLDRGLPPQLENIEGEICGGAAVKFDNGQFTISCLEFEGEFKFLNCSFRLWDLDKSMGASGIIGQTLSPVESRVSLDTFIQ